MQTPFETENSSPCRTVTACYVRFLCVNLAGHAFFSLQYRRLEIDQASYQRQPFLGDTDSVWLEAERRSGRAPRPIIF